MFESPEPDDAVRQPVPADASADASPDPAPPTDVADSDPVRQGAQAPPRITRFRASPRGLAVGALALAGIAVGIYFAASSSPGGNTADGRNGSVASTSQATSSPVPGASPLAEGTPGSPAVAPSNSPSLVPAGPKPLRPSNPARVKSWNAGKGGTVLAQITTTIGTVLMAHGTGQYPQMLQACGTLSGIVQSAEALPPIPDVAMEKTYVQSLAAFKAGIAECRAGITQHFSGVEDVVTTVDQGTIRQAISHFDTGMTDLYIATQALRQQ